jgi:hypothetical protein
MEMARLLNKSFAMSSVLRVGGSMTPREVSWRYAALATAMIAER